MGQTNRICKTCGKEYYYCSNCDKSKNSPQWMLIWDTENCKNIFEIVSNFDQGVYTKEEASKKLEKCDLREKYSFNSKIIELIDKIMAKDSVRKAEISTEKVEDSAKKSRLFNVNEKKTEDAE